MLAADSSIPGEVEPSDLPGYSELSAVFHTTSSPRAFRHVLAALRLRSGSKRPISLAGGIYSRRKNLHLDFEARRAADHHFEWELYVHPRAGPVTREDLALSKRVEWIEGLTRLLHSAYPEPTGVSCSVQFELEAASYANAFGLPMRAPAGILPPRLVPDTAKIFSIGFETEDLRAGASLTDDGRLLTLGVGFYLQNVPLEDIVGRIEQNGRQRAARLVRRRA